MNLINSRALTIRADRTWYSEPPRCNFAHCIHISFSNIRTGLLACDGRLVLGYICRSGPKQQYTTRQHSLGPFNNMSTGPSSHHCCERLSPPSKNHHHHHHVRHKLNKGTRLQLTQKRSRTCTQRAGRQTAIGSWVNTCLVDLLKHQTASVHWSMLSTTETFINAQRISTITKTLWAERLLGENDISSENIVFEQRVDIMLYNLSLICRRHVNQDWKKSGSTAAFFSSISQEEGQRRWNEQLTIAQQFNSSVCVCVNVRQFFSTISSFTRSKSIPGKTSQNMICHASGVRRPWESSRRYPIIGGWLWPSHISWATINWPQVSKNLCTLLSHDYRWLADGLELVPKSVPA